MADLTEEAGALYLGDLTERERKLPQYVQNRLCNLRHEVTRLTAEADTARATVEELTSQTNPKGRPINAVLPDGTEVGLTGDTEIFFHLGKRIFTCAIQDDALLVDLVGGSIVVTAQAAYQILISGVDQ